MARSHQDKNLPELHDSPAYGPDADHDIPQPPARRNDGRARVSKTRQDERPATARANSVSGAYGADYDDGYPEEPPPYGENSRRGSQRARNERDRGNRDHNRDRDRERDERRPETSSWAGSRSAGFLRTGIKTVRHALNPADTQSQGYGDSRSRDNTRHQQNPRPTNGFEPRATEFEENAYMKKMEHLEIQLASANSHIESLNNEIRAKEEAGVQLKRRNNAMQSSRDAQEELLGRQDEDLSIGSTFEGLFHQVKTWTGKFCSTASSSMVVTGVHRGQLARIQRVLPSLTDAEDLPEFLPVGALRRRRQFIRGCVGLVLAETLIRSLPGTSHPTSVGQDYWLPVKVCDGVRELESALLGSGGAITLTAFHQWRTITMSLLGKVYPPSRWAQSQDTINFVEDQVDFTLSIIHPLASHPSDGEFREKLLDNIFIPAVEFSQFLRRQRACWSVRFPSLTPTNALPPSESVANLFDRTTMEDRDSLADDDLEDASTDQCLKSVEIVVTPILFKSGNHDGLKYDVVVAYKKAEVSCAEIRRK